MNQVQQFFEYILNAVKIWVIVMPWETGIRVRNGKTIKILTKGIYFRIPYFDSVFIQEARLRVVSLPIQTLTTKDLKTITLNGSIGYSIDSIETLFNTLYHPETTLQNLAMAEISNFIYKADLLNLNQESIEETVLSKLSTLDYGLNFKYFKITNFAVVRTYRLIQDQSWVQEGLTMDNKK